MAVSKRLRFEVLRRDGHACYYCGRKPPEVKLTVDHVVPVALGGQDAPENLVAACSDCNSGKTSSSPDAPLVANVADDAARWALAIRSVGDDMVKDHARRSALYGKFETAWNNWETPSGYLAPLPNGWQQSVDNFINAGLPMPVLIECIEIAMNNSNVSMGRAFRYTCGVAWNRIKTLQKEAADRARDPLAPNLASAPMGQPTVDDVLGHLWGCWSENVTPEVIRRLADAYRDRMREDEEQPWAGWSEDVLAACMGIMQLAEDAEASRSWVHILLHKLPPHVRSAALSESTHLHEEHNPDGMTEESVERFACLQVVGQMVQLIDGLNLMDELRRRIEPSGSERCPF